MEKKLAILVHGLGTSYTDRSVLDDLIPNLSSIGFDVVHHLFDLDVGTTVFWAF